MFKWVFSKPGPLADSILSANERVNRKRGRTIVCTMGKLYRNIALWVGSERSCVMEKISEVMEDGEAAGLG